MNSFDILLVILLDILLVFFLVLMSTRPLARNLMLEASSKRHKSTVPSVGLQSLMEVTGANYAEKTSAVVVQVSEELCQSTVDSQELNMMKDLSVIPGVYWKIGVLGDASCFRQEPSDGVNSQELFMFRVDTEGWFLASKKTQET